MSEHVISRTYEDLLDVYHGALLEGIDEYWAARTPDDIRREMPEPMYVPIDADRSVKLIEIAPPDATDHDTSHDIAFSLPHLNPYNLKSYIRARTLQLANPNFSVWLVPDNTFRNKASIFNDEEKYRLAHGDIRPLGEIQMRAFERNPFRIEKLAATGHAQGGLAALALACIKGGIEVDRVNADEIPLKNADTQGDTGQQVSVGSAEHLIEAALNNDVAVKLGFIANKHLLENETLISRLLDSPLLTVVQYQGERFKHMHTIDDRVKIHALMANDGLHLH